MEPVDYASVCILNICDPSRKNYLGSHICTGRSGDVMLFDHAKGDTAFQTPPGDPGTRAS